MDGYIRREDVIAWFMPYAHVGESIDADVVISDIKGMKAADVAQVVHGRWVPTKAPFMNECKDCIRRYDTDECPMCFLIEGKYYEYTNGNGFCDSGEKKEGAGNG